MTHTPIVRGGQGRTASSLRSDLGFFGWLLVALIATLTYAAM